MDIYIPYAWLVLAQGQMHRGTKRSQPLQRNIRPARSLITTVVFL